MSEQKYVNQLVAKKINSGDRIKLLVVTVVLVSITVASMYIPVLKNFFVIVTFFACFVLYKYVSHVLIEYDYSIIGNELRIEIVRGKRARKKFFVTEFSDIKIMAPVISEHYTQDIKNSQNSIFAVASEKNLENTYFVCANYEGKQTVLYFDPNEDMLDVFDKTMRRKFFRKENEV